LGIRSGKTDGSKRSQKGVQKKKKKKTQNQKQKQKQKPPSRRAGRHHLVLPYEIEGYWLSDSNGKRLCIKTDKAYSEAIEQSAIIIPMQ
jgi:hypothetical protein